MADKRYPDGPLTSASHAFAVAPHDVNELAQIPRAIYVGGAGNITVRLADSPADVVFMNVPAGAILDIQPRFIRATGTTATLMVALA